MKIGLLTYHNADNYGATLQSYATYKILIQLGYDVEFIDIDIDEPNPLLKKLLLLPKHLRFNQFRKKYFKNITKKYKSLNELRLEPPKADIYMIGSDQTWNVDISKWNAKAFFLDFGGEHIKRVSYAPSFGKEKWDENKWISTEEASFLLKKMDLVSVREKSGIEICENIFGVSATQVIDPVLLHTGYPEITGNITPDKEGIIAYKLVDDDLFYDLARQLGKYCELPVRSIGSLRRISGVKSKYPESVPEWLKAICEARYVLTDSFHGVICSLIYQKQFIVTIGNPKRITRIQSILSELGLSDRILKSSDSIDLYKEKLEQQIDYEFVNKKIESLRKSSMEYLYKIGF